MAVFINPAEGPETRALKDFVPVGQRGIQYGQDADLAGAIPPELLRIGRVIGKMEESGLWVAEWRYVPANYLVGVHLDAPRPLVRRIDPADTGLGDGLQLLPGKDMEAPFEMSYWRHRFGLGCGNRLNGVVLECGTGGSYSIPSGFA
jgi:hypothetical protein